MLGAFLAIRHGLDLRRAIESAELAARLGPPRVGYDHNGASSLGEAGPDNHAGRAVRPSSRRRSSGGALGNEARKPGRQRRPCGDGPVARR